MAEAKHRSHRGQEEALERASGAPPFYVVSVLRELLAREPNLRLDPRWRSIWKSAREEVLAERDTPDTLVHTIDQAIASIESLDPAIKGLALKDSAHVCLLLGAGASVASTIPTVVDLLPELWRRARKLGREDIDRLANWCDARRVTNIEDLLTAAYLANFAAKNAAISSLLDYFLFKERGADDPRYRLQQRRPMTRPMSEVDASSVALFQETLQGLFGLLASTMIPAKPNPAHDAVLDFVKSHPASSIVTTNYDGCVDEAFIRAAMPLNTYVSGTAPISGALDLIKIHGSINWSYCESCHEVKEFDLLTLKKGYLDDSLSYAVVGICKNCSGQRRPLLIPPMGLKFVMFPNLIRLWNLARERIESASYVVVVGFSFAEADSYINKIIERSMSFHKEQTIIVCDPNESLATSLRARFAARLDAFKGSRVLAAVGPAEKLLPQVLSAMRATAAPEPRSTSHRDSRPRRKPKRTGTGAV